MVSNVIVAKIAAPILVFVVLATLKPFLRLLTPLVNISNQERYLDNIQVFNAKSEIGASSLLALLICIIVYATVSFSTDKWVGESNARFVALFCAILSFYFYFFLHFRFQASGNKGKLKYTTEKLTKIKLKNIEFDDVIYGERSQSGAMGNAGGIILYEFKQNRMLRYETSVYDDEETSMEALRQIALHEELFNLYYGGMGNGVFVNKNVKLGVDKARRCFWFSHNNMQVRIDSSVEGVFMMASDHMVKGTPQVSCEQHEDWEKSHRDFLIK